MHWSTVGDPRAKDRTVMAWARENEYVVFTHDLDFGTLLALTRDSGPSVIQVRTHDVLPAHLEQLVITALGRMSRSCTKVRSSRSTNQQRLPADAYELVGRQGYNDRADQKESSDD